MEILLIAAALGCIPAAIAQSKGRGFFGFWIYGTLLFIVALPHALIMKPDQSRLDAKALAAGGRRKCPFCAELIRREAKVCPHCQRDLARPKPKTPLAGREPPRIETRWD